MCRPLLQIICEVFVGSWGGNLLLSIFLHWFVQQTPSVLLAFRLRGASPVQTARFAALSLVEDTCVMTEGGGVWLSISQIEALSSASIRIALMLADCVAVEVKAGEYRSVLNATG